MHRPFRYKAINWVDGMKLSSAQFVHSDLYFQEVIRDANSVGIGSFNYGLLPSSNEGNAMFKIQILPKSTNYIEVSVFLCNALTPEGCRIYIDGTDEFAVLNQTLSTDGLDKGVYSIVLQTNPFKRIPFGNPDPEESPIRFPYLDFEYTIDIVPSSDVNLKNKSLFFLPIGRFVKNENSITLHDDYIMPSSTISSHPDLVSFHNTLYGKLIDLQTSAFKIMEKTAQQEKITNLGINIRGMSAKVLTFIAENLFAYRSMLRYQSPIYLLKYFSDLANVFFTALKVIPGSEREELLKYFYEWKDVTPNNFEEDLSNIIECQYNHLDIHASIVVSNHFMGVMVSLWHKLSTLEYIGQRRENIVVAEQKVVHEVQAKRTWSLLD